MPASGRAGGDASRRTRSVDATAYGASPIEGYKGARTRASTITRFAAVRARDCIRSRLPATTAGTPPVNGDIMAQLSWSQTISSMETLLPNAWGNGSSIMERSFPAFGRRSGKYLHVPALR